MKFYIDKGLLYDKMVDLFETKGITKHRVLRTIANTPEEDVEERKIGKWEARYPVTMKPGYGCGDSLMPDLHVMCSECRYFTYMISKIPFEFCPHCGAAMDGKNETDKK